MSNYFPNARPNQNIISTLTSLEPSTYLCSGVFLITTGASNLKDELINQYNNDPTDFPAYETERDFIDMLDKVEAVFLLNGKYSFPSLTGSLEVSVPSTGLMLYGNDNFQLLGIGSSANCNITLFTKK